jgi:hypothetical protein
MANKSLDIMEDENEDILWVNGDLVIGDATGQHMRDILAARPGSYRLAPTATIGLPDYLNEDGVDDLTLQIRRKFAQDGLSISNLTIVNGKLDINAVY